MAELAQIAVGQIDLVEIIMRCEFLSEDEKKEYLALVHEASELKRREIADFFLGAERELQTIRDDFENQKATVYEKYLAELEHVAHNAERMVATESEKRDRSNENNQAEQLLNGF